MSLQTSVESADFPVIDISQFPVESDSEDLNHLQDLELIGKVREACKEWGFFFVVNHGIAADLVEDVMSQIQQLCAMPAEVKARVSTTAYRAPPPWNLSFDLPNLPHLDSVQEMSQKIWPEYGNPKFCEKIGTYGIMVDDLLRKISKIILVSLDLDIKTFYHSAFEKCTSNIRINSYLSNENSMEEEILHSHTDTGCLTILHNDNQQGLQVLSRQGKWLDVNRLPHSFVVNVGDSLKAWSNGRFHSSAHRVVYRGWKHRISLATSFYFPHDHKIWAPEELVDEHHPRLYKPYTYSEYRLNYDPTIHSKEANRIQFLDVFAGI
ncbi:hypothetical protein SUGI_0460800 [Cryptomeria japonica]|uniref:probable 2-oxoglutarate-dependent dioxygenase AOP1 n=1 Tax=Cryptomeria japonica TaxID=3369 RepID=UPI002408D5DF|nr:probable 2-oxoglutarate-dependent dioxygenase AOP1 [Cryptomeria japonica]GLJ24154.1 hypothetical protein SUGI_0460800 [Cryptomeria japonica]